MLAAPLAWLIAAVMVVSALGLLMLAVAAGIVLSAPRR